MIKGLTEQLAEAGKGIIQLEPEVSDNTNQFLAFDDGGVECEVGEFLYGLVRILKPEAICETGTYSGISSMYMGQALKDNKKGRLITLEISSTHKERAEKLWTQVDVGQFISCQQISSIEYKTEQLFDLIFLDSEPEHRFNELVKFYPNLKPGGFIFIHDLHRHLSQHDNEKFFGWPFGKLPDEINNLLMRDQLRVISFPTPRGLTGFYKPKEDDYGLI